MMSMQAIAKTFLAIAAIVIIVTACSPPAPQTTPFISPTTTQAPQTQPTLTNTSSDDCIFHSNTQAAVPDLWHTTDPDCNDAEPILGIVEGD